MAVDTSLSAPYPFTEFDRRAARLMTRGIFVSSGLYELPRWSVTVLVEVAIPDRVSFPTQQGPVSALRDSASVAGEVGCS
jgi:hypothetical protein